MAQIDVTHKSGGAGIRALSMFGVEGLSILLLPLLNDLGRRYGLKFPD